MESDLSPEVINDLLNLLKDPKLEVKKGTLCVILQFCTESVHRQHFENTDIIKTLLRNMNENGLETISLSNLISFSQDDFFINKIFELNGVDRFFEQLKNILKSEDINQFNDEKKLIIELNLLVLSNLSRTEKGCHLIFNLENKDKSGVNFWLFFELFINKKTTNLFKFFGNILSNVTAIKEIRDYLISANFNIIERLIQFIYYPNKEIRVNVMKTIRNLNFEFENNEYLSQIIDPKIDFLEKFIQYGIFGINCTSNFINEQNNEIFLKLLKCYNLEFVPQQYIWTDFKFEEEISIIIDIFVVLTNVPDVETKLKFNKEALIIFLELIKTHFTQEVKDRIDVINCLFCNINSI